MLWVWSAAGFLWCSCASVSLAVDQIRKQRAAADDSEQSKRGSEGVSISGSFILCNSFLTAHLWASATDNTRWRCLFLFASSTSQAHLYWEKKEVALLNPDIDIPMQYSTPTTLTDKCSCLECWLLLAAQFFSCIDFWISLFWDKLVSLFSLLTHTKHCLSTIFSFLHLPPEDTIIGDALNNAKRRTFRDGVMEHLLPPLERQRNADRALRYCLATMIRPA